MWAKPTDVGVHVVSATFASHTTIEETTFRIKTEWKRMRVRKSSTNAAATITDCYRLWLIGFAQKHQHDSARGGGPHTTGKTVRPSLDGDGPVNALTLSASCNTRQSQMEMARLMFTIHYGLWQHEKEEWWHEEHHTRIPVEVVTVESHGGWSTAGRAISSVTLKNIPNNVCKDGGSDAAQDGRA